MFALIPGLRRALPLAALVVLGSMGATSPPLDGSGLSGAHASRWSGDGHRIVCRIAWSRLSEDARIEARRLLALDPLYGDFPESCVWADEIRSLVEQGVEGVARLAHYASAHYVNTPAGSPGIDPASCTRVRQGRPDAPCVVDAIAEFVDSLTHSARDAHRLEALKFIGHFTGDLHQPLHAGYGVDRGGNDTRVNVMGRPDRTLHYVWDALFLEYDGRAWHALADSLGAAVRPVDAMLWTASDPLRWANESCQIVEHDVYAPLQVDPGAGPAYVGEDYFDRNTHTVMRQLQKAGVRLAALLEPLLVGEAPIP